MSGENKKEPWRIAVFIISILFIVFMWIGNDVLTIYATMDKEQIVPLIVTTVGVSLIKVFAIIIAVQLIRWIVKNIKNK